MDSTIIGAIIGGLATIIGGLVTALLTLRASASRNREELKTIYDAGFNAAVKISDRASNAKEPEERAFLQDNLKVLEGLTSETTTNFKEAKVKIQPEEQRLLFVVQKDNPCPMFNILTRLTNETQQVAMVDGLEAILTGPEGVSFRFVWRLFYSVKRGGSLHTMSSYVHPLVLEPTSSRIVGIQFVGPDLGMAKLYSWPIGRYQVEIVGWVNRTRADQSANVSSKFYIHLSSQEIAQLKACINWDDAAWARYPTPVSPDPDKAAAVPIRIVTG